MKLLYFIGILILIMALLPCLAEINTHKALKGAEEIKNRKDGFYVK